MKFFEPETLQPTGVIPAKAGTHFTSRAGGEMDPRIRGDDTEDGVAAMVRSHRDQ